MWLKGSLRLTQIINSTFGESCTRYVSNAKHVQSQNRSLTVQADDSKCRMLLVLSCTRVRPNLLPAMYVRRHLPLSFLASEVRAPSTLALSVSIAGWFAHRAQAGSGSRKQSVHIARRSITMNAYGSWGRRHASPCLIHGLLMLGRVRRANHALMVAA